MAENKKDEIQHEYRINAKEGLNTLSKLQIEYDELTKYIDKLGVKLQKQQILLDKAIPNSKREEKLKKGIAELNKELDKSIPKQAQVTKQIAEQTTATDLTTLSKKQLNRQLSYLKDQYDRLNPVQADYIEQQKRLQQEAANVNKELQARGPLLEKQTSFLESLKGGLPAAVIGGVAGGAVGVIGDLLSNAVDGIFNVFKRKAATDKAYGGLSAILGLDFEKDPESLKFYKQTVSDLGKEFKIAGNEIIKTIQIVGSLKPELLAQKEALRDVTADVIRLSRASGDVLSIADAAEAVTGSLNQFGEDASQSTRYINVLAAGAKEGASEINQTAAAFKKSGAVLRASNVSYEQSNALVQVLSTKMIRGEEAGTALRNIFSKLLTGSEELNPAIHGVNVVLERLAKLSPAEMMKLFGQETVVAAMELVKARGKVDSMTKAITGTNEAFEQYRKQTDNLSGDLDQLAASSSRFWATLTNSSSSWMRKMTQGLSNIIEQLTYMYNNFSYDKDKGTFIIDKKYRSEQETINRTKIVNDSANQQVKDDVKDLTPLQKGKTAQEKELNAYRKTLAQSREIYQQHFDNYNRLVKANASKEEIELAERNRKIAGKKISIAKQNIERLENNERENADLVKKIREGVTDDEKKDADKQKELLEQRKENTEKVVEEIYRMNIEAIDDESAKKKAKLEADLYFQYQERLKLVDEQKMEQKDLDVWYIAQEKSLQNSIAQIDKEASDKKLKDEKEAAEKVAMMVLQTRLDNAQASGDEEQILLAKIAIEKQKFDVEIEKATVDMKQALYEQYLANIAKLHADHRKKEEEAEKAYGQKIFEILKKNAGKKKQEEDNLEKEKRELQIQMAREGTDLVFSILSAGLEKQNTAVTNQYDRENAALERNKEKGLITEEDYAAQKSVIEKNYQKQIAEIKRKQAIYDKAQALIQIAINTAVNIASKPALAPLYLGVGALQAGIVLAKPLPELPSFDQGGDTNIFDRRMPANDGKRGFLSILHPDEYVIPKNVRNTRYWANIEPVIEAMRTNKMQSFERGGSSTPMPTFSNSTSTAQPQAITVDLGPDFYNLMIALKSQMDVGITLNYHDRATLAEKLAEQEQMYKNSMISKTPNSL